MSKQPKRPWRVDVWYEHKDWRYYGYYMRPRWVNRRTYQHQLDAKATAKSLTQYKTRVIHRSLVMPKYVKPWRLEFWEPRYRCYSYLSAFSTAEKAENSHWMRAGKRKLRLINRQTGECYYPEAKSDEPCEIPL